MNTQAQQNSYDPVKALELAISAEQNRPDRLPGLVAVFNRIPEAFARDLGGLSFIKPDIVLANLSVGRFCDVCKMPEGAVEAVVWAEKWHGQICFLADCTTVLSFVEAALGYDPTLPSQFTQRPVTKVECDLVTLLFRRLARSLADAFSAYIDVVFEVTSVADRDALAAVCPQNALMVVGRLNINYAGKQGVVTIAVPQKLLEPAQNVLRARPAVAVVQEEILGTDRDTNWSHQLSNEIARAFIGTKAVLDQRLITLQEVAALKVGSTVPLSTVSMSRARLELDERPLFWCMIGRQGAHLALQIESDYENDRETEDDVL